MNANQELRAAADTLYDALAREGAADAPDITISAMRLIGLVREHVHAEPDRWTDPLRGQAVAHGQAMLAQSSNWHGGA